MFNPLQNHHFGTENDPTMNFSILTPLPPCTQVPLFGGMGVGVWGGGGQITSQRLLDQSQAGVYMGKTPHTPPFWPFWAYSRTLPQGVELLV